MSHPDSPPPAGYRFEPLTPARWGDLEALFGARGACGGCGRQSFPVSQFPSPLVP